MSSEYNVCRVNGHMPAERISISGIGNARGMSDVSNYTDESTMLNPVGGAVVSDVWRCTSKVNVIDSSWPGALSMLLRSARLIFDSLKGTRVIISDAVDINKHSVADTFFYRQGSCILHI